MVTIGIKIKNSTIILYYLVEASGDRLGEVQIFRVGKRNDGEVYQNL